MHSGARLRRDNSNTIYQHLKTIGKFESHDSQRFKETRYIEFGVNNVRGLGLGDYCWGSRLDLKECCMLTRGQGIKMVPLTWIEIKLNWKKKQKKNCIHDHLSFKLLQTNKCYQRFTNGKPWQYIFFIILFFEWS